MGTRADFYIGRGEKAEWLGSTAWDGYPNGISPRSAETKKYEWPGGGEYHPDMPWPEGQHLFDAKTEVEFKERLELYFKHREDVTRPSDGWPWPWNDSRTTDYAYAFDAGQVWCCPFGHGWFLAKDKEPDEETSPEFYKTQIAVFPNMESVKKINWDKRSGLIMVTGKQ